VASIDSTSLKIEKDPSLEKWIDKLGAHENCPPEGIIDSNGLRSYGRYCYQEGTFIMFVKIYRKKGYELLPQAEDSELLNMIGDDHFTKELTYIVFKENPGDWTHWRNSVKKIGVPPNLNLESGS
jgi:hypothetical protein